MAQSLQNLIRFQRTSGAALRGVRCRNGVGKPSEQLQPCPKRRLGNETIFGLRDLFDKDSYRPSKLARAGEQQLISCTIGRSQPPDPSTEWSAGVDLPGVGAGCSQRHSVSEQFHWPSAVLMTRSHCQPDGPKGQVSC